MDYKALYDERKGNVLDLLKKAIQFYTNLNDEEKTSSLIDLASSVQNGKFSIVVVGQFSAGKSTFLNALMGEKYLPSFTTETTATINFLRSVNESPTKKPLIKVNYKDGKEERCEEVTLENIEKFVSTKGVDVAKKILSVEVFLDSKYLNDGVSLVDSPGLNGVLEGHEQITNDQIDRSHAAIFMFNAKQPGSKSDFEKLNMLLRKCNSVLIVLNQKDLVKEDEQTIDDVVHNLKQNYAKYFNTDQLPEIFPISSYQALVARSKRKLDYNGKTDFSAEQRQDLLDSSEIEAFETRLIKYLTQGEKAQKELLSPVEKVHAFLTETEASIASEIEQLSNTVDADEVRLQISQLKDELETLSAKLNSTRTDIRNKVSDILRDAEMEIKASAADTKASCLNQITDAEDLEELEANARIYTNRVYNKYIQIWEDVSAKVDRRYRELIADEYNEYASAIEERMREKQGDNSIEFSKISLDGSLFEVDIDIDDFFEKRSELLQQMDEGADRLDALQLEEIKAKENNAKLERLERAKAQLREDRRLDIESLGYRPQIQTYTATETRKVGGLKGLWKWVTTGSRDQNSIVTRSDDSARREYDRQRVEIEENSRREIEYLESQKQLIPITDLGSIEAKKRQIERAIQRQQQQLEDLMATYEKNKAKIQRSKKRQAEAYVENLIEDIEKENLYKIYEMLRNNKDVMTNAALDILQMELQSVISRKKEDIERREKQLSSSQEEKAKLIEDLTATKSTLSLIKEEANSCKAEISSIQTDKIKRS
ncbi:dynamin family protein [Capnocytophaga granulosa]|uniref:dynamin family protein n=1 Tax=Capnocytophaga granulosa TaxID=45242 RepID=UPI003C70B80C